MSEFFIDKSETERVRLGVNEYQGRNYIDIRVFYQDEGGDWHPTKKGVTLPTDKLDELREAVAGLTVE